MHKPFGIAGFSLNRTIIFPSIGLLGIFTLFPEVLWADANFFVVKNIQVTLPQHTNDLNHSRSTALIRGETVAFNRLIERMLTGADRSTAKNWILDLKGERRRFIQRSIVVSEKKVSRDLEMKMDILFDSEILRKAFVQASVPYCEVSYPSTLLVFNDKNMMKETSDLIRSAFEQRANHFGISLLHPLWDMDDLTHLVPENILAPDPDFFAWIKARYGVDRIWFLATDLPETDSSSHTVPDHSGTSLLEYSAQGLEGQYRVAEGMESVKLKEQKRVLVDLATHLVFQVTDTWINKNKVEPYLDQEFTLRIVHVINLQLYNQTLKQMESIPGVSEVQFLEYTSDAALLRLKFQGPMEKLEQQITKLGLTVTHQGDEMVITLP